MALVKGIFTLIAGLIGSLISALALPDGFVRAVDGAFSFMISTMTSASWFVPLDVLIVCLTAIWLVDNYLIIFHIVKWIIGFIRG